MCFFLAWRINPQTPFQEGFKLLLILIGVFAALWAFVTGADYLIHRGIIHIKAVRQAWFAPTLAIADRVLSMNPAQLRVFERVDPIVTVSYLHDRQVRDFLRTPMGEVPYPFISEYMEKCAPIYPTLIPQHGMPDSLQRDYVRWFTNEMVRNGIAERPRGNIPAKWLLPFDEVMEILGL